MLLNKNFGGSPLVLTRGLSGTVGPWLWRWNVGRVYRDTFVDSRRGGGCVVISPSHDVMVGEMILTRTRSSSPTNQNCANGGYFSGDAVAKVRPRKVANIIDDRNQSHRLFGPPPLDAVQLTLLSSPLFGRITFTMMSLSRTVAPRALRGNLAPLPPTRRVNVDRSLQLRPPSHTL